jgi:hypothetical protein
MTTLDLKAAFFHVIDPHRWLAASACAWNLVGKDASNGTKEAAHNLVPNIDVFVRDCLLLHARLLIKFYRSVKTRDTDILLCDFKIPRIPRPLDKGLADFENSIEVHLLHLTDWRDGDYRKQDAVGNDAKRDRRDWDHEVIPLVNLIFATLKHVSEQEGDWQQPFQDLYQASTQRYGNKSCDWPATLCEKSDVNRYLEDRGL